LITTFLFWSPFILRATSWFGLNIPNSDFLYIYRHYDGPLYAVVAKTLYNPWKIESFILDISFDVKYFAAHLPLYPLLVRIFVPLFNYSQATIFVNLISTMILGVFFHYFVKHFALTKKPLLLTFVLLMFPRFLVVRSVGAPESLFMLLLLLSLAFFEKNNLLLAGVFGGLATMTKTPGILLFAAYILFFLEKGNVPYVILNGVKNLLRQPRLTWRTLKSNSNELRDPPLIAQADKKRNWRFLYVLLIPLGLLLVFFIYHIQYNDFFAYFHSGDNIHLVAPFAVFNSANRWVGNGWLEDVLLYFFLYLTAVIYLKSIKYRSFFYFSLVFFLGTVMVQHRDIGRYSLPMWPLAAIAFEKFFTSKKFLLVLVLLLPAIYLYAWNFSLQNMLPVSDWTSFFSK